MQGAGVKALTDISRQIGKAAEANGWHDRYLALLDSGDYEGQREHIISKLALITSEASEAIEEIRDGHLEEYEINGKPEGLPVELADVIIRALDLAHLLSIPIGDVVARKLAFNATRGKMHGGKTI